MVVKGIRIVRTPRVTGVLSIIIIGWLSSAPGTARVPWIATAAATIAAIAPWPLGWLFVILLFNSLC